MIPARVPETCPAQWGYRYADSPGSVIECDEKRARRTAKRDYSAEVVCRSALSRGEWVVMPSEQPDGVVR